jgi:hypothetical protein
MNTMTLEKQILARIRREKVKPKARGYFVARDTGIWILVLAFVAALGVSFGMVIFTVVSADNALLNRLGFSRFEKIASSVPYFWLLATMVVGLGSYAGYRSTRRGYRLGVSRFFAVLGILTIGAGGLVYALRIAEYVDTVASENIPIYNIIVPINTSSWFDPDNGLLSGTVKSRESEDELIIRDQDLGTWFIDSSDLDIFNDPRYQSGERVKLIGERTGLDTFKAIEIHPWRD